MADCLFNEQNPFHIHLKTLHGFVTLPSVFNRVSIRAQTPPERQTHLLHHGVQGDGWKVELLEHHCKDLTVPATIFKCVECVLIAYISFVSKHKEDRHEFQSRLCFLLARVGENDDGPVVMLVSEGLYQVHQVGVLHLLWSQDVSLVQLIHRSGSAHNFMSNCFRYLFSYEEGHL